MAITISLRKQADENDEELLLFPEAGGMPVMDERAVAPDESWLVSHDEGRLAVDVYESDREIVIRSAIAGVRTEDLEVFVYNDMLTIRGWRSVEDEPSAKPLVRECHWGSFSRSIILPTEIDADRIAAALKDGVLTIRLPKIERSRKISVQEVR